MGHIITPPHIVAAATAAVTPVPGELLLYVSPQASVVCGDPTKNQITISWVNEGCPMYVRHGWVWVGVQRLGEADVSYWLYNQTRNQVFDFINEDHYGPRASIEGNRGKFDCKPTFKFIDTGDTMCLYLCAVGPYSNIGNILVGAFAGIYYTSTLLASDAAA